MSMCSHYISFSQSESCDQVTLKVKQHFRVLRNSFSKFPVQSQKPQGMNISTNQETLIYGENLKFQHFYISKWKVVGNCLPLRKNEN